MQQLHPRKRKRVVYRKRWYHGWGISFGSALAMVLSFGKNESILWAIIHGLLSWIYVLYRIILELV